MRKQEKHFLNQQQQGRRPRLDLYTKIIVPNSLIPIKTGNIDDW
jgi:hypothetical protein